MTMARRDVKVSAIPGRQDFDQWPDDIDGDMIEGRWRVVADAVTDEDGNEVTPADIQLTETARPLSPQERVEYEADAAALLVPRLTDDDVKKTVAVSAENDFRTDGWFAVHRQMWHGLLDTLVGLGVVTEQQVGALRITEAHTQAVLDGAAQAIVQMKDPEVREAFTEARIKGAEQRGRP